MSLRNKRWGHIALVSITLLGLLIFGFISSARAADFRGGERVIIETDEVIDDDLFANGQRIEVDGTIRGDLFASGQEVVINGQVEGSVFMSGQTLEMNGQIDGSLYASGYSLVVGRTAEIGRNLYFGGFSLETEPDSVVNRSVYGGGYQLLLNGDIAGDVSTGSAALELNGAVDGDVSAEVSEAGQRPVFMPNFPGSVPVVAPGYRLGDTASIGGQENIAISSAQVDVGDSVAAFAWSVLRARLGEFITLLIVGGLLVWLWPVMVQQVSGTAQEKPLPSAGWGCLITIIVPIALAVVMLILIVIALLLGLLTFGQLRGDILTIGGISVAWLTVVFTFIFFTVTKVVIAYLVGRLILSRFTGALSSSWLNAAALVLGVLIYEIVRVIPFVGGLVAALVMLVGLGAMYLTLRQPERPALPPPMESTPPPVSPESEPVPDTTS